MGKRKFLTILHHLFSIEFPLFVFQELFRYKLCTISFLPSLGIKIVARGQSSAHDMMLSRRGGFLVQ